MSSTKAAWSPSPQDPYIEHLENEIIRLHRLLAIVIADLKKHDVHLARAHREGVDCATTKGEIVRRDVRTAEGIDRRRMTKPSDDERSVEGAFWASVIKYASQGMPLPASVAKRPGGASVPHVEHDFDAELGMFWYDARGKP